MAATATGMGSTVWLLIAAIAAGTFLFRLSFVAVAARVRSIPPAVEPPLALLPVAALSALAVPAVLLADGAIAVDPAAGRLPAALVAVAAARLTGRLGPTIGAGLATFWGIRALAAT